MCYRCVVLLLSVFLIIPLSGCWNNQETQTLAIVTALGIDSVSRENKQIYQITASVIQPGKVVNNNSGNSQNITLTSEGTTITEAVHNLSFSFPRKVYLTHTEVIVLGREVGAQKLDEVMDYLIRSTQVRMSCLIVVAKSNASAIIKCPNIFEQDVSTEISNLLYEGQEVAPQIAITDLRDFSLAMLTPGEDAWAPMVSVTKGRASGEEAILQSSGLVIYHNDRLVDTLSSSDTMPLMLMMNKFKGGQYSLETQGKVIGLELLSVKSKILVSVREHPEITITVDVKADVSESSGDDQIAADYSDIKNSLAQDLQEQLTDIFHRTQSTQADILGIGRKLEIADRNYWDSIEGEWPRIYASLQPDIKVNFSIRKGGLATSPFKSKLSR
ncbi:Ger(x)C family spore germination protein [Desulfosporosinus sp. PR]|nr:Ger(x)C family spore germination protein [Desulfosporosinus sp. PR]